MIYFKVTSLTKENKKIGEAIISENDILDILDWITMNPDNVYKVLVNRFHKE